MKKLSIKELKRVKKFHLKQSKFHLKQAEKCQKEIERRNKAGQRIGFKLY